MSIPLRSALRRLLRSATAVLCLLSLLLCVAACGLWVGSRDPEPFVASLVKGERTYEVRSRDGSLSVLRINGRRPAGNAPGLTVLQAANAFTRAFPPPPAKQAFAGVEVERGHLDAMENRTALAWTTGVSFTVVGNSPPGAAWDSSDGRISLAGGATTLTATRIRFDGAVSDAAPAPPPLTAVRVTVPYRLLAAATALLPALWLGLAARGAWSARRVVRRSRAGLCAGCGYDLRGTPAAARCPECGQTREPLPA